jgi:para-aminobenzoate synthetase component 1
MHNSSKPTAFEPHIVDLKEEFSGARTLAPASVLGMLRKHDRLVLLHSAGGKPRRFSLLGFDPVVALDDCPGDALEIATFEQLRVATEVQCTGFVPGPFAGGFLGALSYDFGAANLDLELPADLAPESLGQPKIIGGVFTDFVVWDHEAESISLVVNRSRTDFETRLRTVLKELDRSALPAPSASSTFQAEPVFFRDTAAVVHEQRVEATRQAIRRGDLYQANLAHWIRGRVTGDAVDVYRALAEENEAPYMGFASWPGGALLSASPELLLELVRDSSGDLVATTRPIKGTAPRGATPAEDKARADQLLASAKDRAELAMIVDLERNDFGRVARAGGVTVGEFPRLETFAAVHHLVADVSAILKPGENAYSLLASVFPGGSITGAPKLASMELIAELEGRERGFFCGGLGFVDSRGSACFNILIRTILWRDDAGDADQGDQPANIAMAVGGGITWASDPRLEDEETLHKAASLLSALGVQELRDAP